MVTLYKKDSKEYIRFWQVTTEGSEIVQTSGRIDTDSPVEHRKTAKAKNVGRANETTPEEQAVKEAEAMHEKKLKEGYFGSQEDAETVTFVKPMLAKTYKPGKTKVKWESAFVQPKLDGMRCLAEIKNGKVTLNSRKNRLIDTVQHINDALSSIPDDIILDGELYAHEYSFQENMSMIKKYRKGETEKISYHVYDMIYSDPFPDRFNIARKLIKDLPDCIKIVPTVRCFDQNFLEVNHSHIVGKGYEGTIIRHTTKGYQMKRSSCLLKYKDFIDESYEIVDIKPMDAYPEQGIVICKTDQDQVFSASYKGSHKEREELLTNKSDYVGRTAEIRFFEYTDDGIPRFPVCVGFREDK